MFWSFQRTKMYESLDGTCEVVFFSKIGTFQPEKQTT